ncbi:hypothetical protein Q9R20_06365 [Microbacterium sp. PRF11]|uniref:hypothetical protein n=1 Tax=Microbacterium sp. PRF11 TaxID=2962593 RepID=UPI002881BC0A|nr:hypothetical protein [Microbacterium sp. PRF11]MDT0116611.1 hypothetical protein [Microbacterium sp. PRF11]
MYRRIRAACAVVAVLAVIGASTTAQAASLEQTAEAPLNGTTASEPPIHVELPFAHPVSLESAVTVEQGAGLPILGYHFESDSIAGDFWMGPDADPVAFLDDIERSTGTAPEVIGAYVDGEAYTTQRSQARSASPELLGSDLPVFDAPDAVAPDTSKLLNGADREVPSAVASARASSTWEPTSAEAMIRDQGARVSITAKYSWYGSNPFAAPHQMAEGWGMEFQFDFYTHRRFGPTNQGWSGVRPQCGRSDYKDWAAASNRPFDWFAIVINGTNSVVAPREIGFYGDYNDLFDKCVVTSVSVGAAAPWRIPSTVAGTQDVMIQMYPYRGLDTQSVVGSLVQPVSRKWCEDNPSMPLTDCMGVWPGTYPGPGATDNRPVLGDGRGWTAPDLCWTSLNYGRTSADTFSWDCNSGG